MRAARRILSLDRLLLELARRRAAGQKISFANGIFDILHVGHLRYLEEARGQADLLVVGINSDQSTRALKGSSRPIVPAHERAELLAGFACVDYVTIFEESTVTELLRACRPDVHCKGTDYTVETVPEAAVARELGIRVAIVGDKKEHSTRDLVRKVRGN